MGVAVQDELGPVACDDGLQGRRIQQTLARRDAVRERRVMDQDHPVHRRAPARLQEGRPGGRADRRRCCRRPKGAGWAGRSKPRSARPGRGSAASGNAVGSDPSAGRMPGSRPRPRAGRRQGRRPGRRGSRGPRRPCRAARAGAGARAPARIRPGGPAASGRPVTAIRSAAIRPAASTSGLEHPGVVRPRAPRASSSGRSARACSRTRTTARFRGGRRESRRRESG